MKFKLFNREVEIEDVNYEKSLTSPHTGNELESIYFDLQVVGESVNKDIQEEIKNIKDGGIFSVDDEGNKLKEYRLVKNSYSYNVSYSSENTVYNYTLYLEEIERLKIESLILEDLEIYPYEYKERYNNNAIIIDTKVRLTKSEAEKLDSLNDNTLYFQVVRNGINEDKIDMRFGKVIWSEDGDFIKKDMTLVEKIYDETREPLTNLFQPELENMKNMIAYTDNLNNELINLLISKEVTTPEEIESIKNKSKKNIKKTSRKFYRVKDIDEF